MDEQMSNDVISEAHISPLQEVAHDCRLTFAGQTKELTELEDKSFINTCYARSKQLISRMYENSYFKKCTAGIEMHNKKGENVYLHLHLRFYSEKRTESLRRQLKRWLEDDYDQDTRGNKNFMFKAVVVRNNDEFMSYPLKMSLKENLCRGFKSQELQEMHKVAKASYIKVVEVNQKKMDNKDNSDSLFERVMAKLKNTTEFNSREICRMFIQTYVEEDRPINRNTIEGYVTNASIKLGILSVDDLMSKWGY